jgi:hypothetical protein
MDGKGVVPVSSPLWWAKGQTKDPSVVVTELVEPVPPLVAGTSAYRARQGET